VIGTADICPHHARGAIDLYPPFASDQPPEGPVRTDVALTRLPGRPT
jgi:hypothetical protein